MCSPFAEPEWPSGIQHRVCCVRHGWSCAPNLHQCLWTCLRVHGSKRLDCHADLYTVNRCCTRDESEDHTSEKTCKKGSTLALKLGADVTRIPKQGYQWPHEKDLCPQKMFKKKVFTFCQFPGSSLYSDSLFLVKRICLTTQLFFSSPPLSLVCPLITLSVSHTLAACKLISANHSCLLPTHRKTQE